MTKTPDTTPQPNYPDQITSDKPQPGAEHAVINAADLRGIEQNPNAPWLTQAHMLCTDMGIAAGHISDRIEALRAQLAAIGAGGVEPLRKQSVTKATCARGGGCAFHDEACAERGRCEFGALTAQPARECLQQSAEPMSEQDAGLLEQAASFLEALANDERNRGNCSTAESAACSAYAVRRLAVQWLQAAPPAPAGVAVPEGWWRKRADEIELQVARSGSKEAMRCYTDMRTLLQAAAAPAQAQGCTRSHPHENMSPMCVLHTGIARLNHAAAIAPAQEYARPDQRRRAKALLDLLNRRPAMNAGLTEEYARWNAECYRCVGTLSQEAANADQAQEHATQLAGGAQEPDVDAAEMARAVHKKLKALRKKDVPMDAYVLLTDAQYVIERLTESRSAAQEVPGGVLDAIRAAGMQLLKGVDGFKLEKAATASASNAGSAALAAAPQAPAAPAPFRTDEQIVGQTEELARLLMLEFYSREAPADALFRNAEDPRGRRVWQIACQAQEILTDTDPENAVAEFDDGPAAPAAPAVDARAERDAAFESVRNRLCGLQRYSFVLDDDGVVRRVQDRTGNWIEFDDVHELLDPVAVDAAIAAQAKGEAA